MTYKTLSKARMAAVRRWYRSRPVYPRYPSSTSLLKECLHDDSKAGARDRAMIALAWQLGPRVHECQCHACGHAVPARQEGRKRGRYVSGMTLLL